MAFNFACAVVDGLGSENSIEALKRINISSIERLGNSFSLDERISKDELLVYRAGEKFLFYGDCIFDVYSRLHALEPGRVIRGRPTMYLIAQLESDNAYGIKCFENGKAGVAHQVGGRRGWHRFVRLDDFPIPSSDSIDRSIESMISSLGVDRKIMHRALYGMYGKGRYGIGFHSGIGEWVICRNFDQKADPQQSQLQQLNPNSYKPKGKLFDKSKDPNSSKSFLSQSDLYYELIHLVLEDLVGFRFDRSNKITNEKIFEKHKVSFDQDIYA